MPRYRLIANAVLGRRRCAPVSAPGRLADPRAPDRLLGRSPRLPCPLSKDASFAPQTRVASDPDHEASATFTSVVTSVAALAVLGGLAVQPDVLNQFAGQRMSPGGRLLRLVEDTAAEELRQDQCLMADVLRLGGPTMATTAQDGLNQPQDKLHGWPTGSTGRTRPLAEAYKKDQDAAAKELDALHALRAPGRSPSTGWRLRRFHRGRASTGRRARRVTCEEASTARPV